MPLTPAALNLSISDLQRLIQERQHELKKLERKRAKIQKKADKLDRQIAALGGTPSHVRRGGGAGSRARNESSLAEMIVKVLEQAAGPLGIGDVMEKVLASGYRTNSGNFRSVVSLNLVKDKRFENVSRGIYQLRNGPAVKTEGKAEKPKRRAKRRAGKKTGRKVGGEVEESSEV